MRLMPRSLAPALSIVAILVATFSSTTRVRASFFLAETYEALGGNAASDDLAEANGILAELLELSKTGAYRAVVQNNNGSAIWIGNSNTKSYFITVGHVAGSATNTLTTYDGTIIPPVSGSVLHRRDGDFALLEYNAVLDPEFFGGESLILLDLHLANNFTGVQTALVGYGNLTIGDRQLGRTRMMSLANLTRLSGFQTQSTISSTFDPDKPFAGVGTVGDSGGGVFMNLDGTNVLIGANSAGNLMTSMVYTNIYQHRDFMDSVVPEGVFTWYTDLVGMVPDTITFLGGDLNNGDNWLASDGVTRGFPTDMDQGIINVNGTLNIGNAAFDFDAMGDLIFGGDAVITTGDDYIAGNANSSIFNNVTINAGDDIFTGFGHLIFNAGSVTKVYDDFEANGGGTLTVNGGTHTTGGEEPTGSSSFGAQGGSTLNFFGGTVVTELFGAKDNGVVFGTINVDGDATLIADSIELAPRGIINFSSTWTGSLTISDMSSANWETVLLDTNAMLDGVPIDAATFASDFHLSPDGTSLSMAPARILGDTNLDGDVNFLDITPLVALLQNQQYLFQADIDGNGVVDFFDISPFIQILAAS